MTFEWVVYRGFAGGLYCILLFLWSSLLFFASFLTIVFIVDGIELPIQITSLLVFSLILSTFMMYIWLSDIQNCKARWEKDKGESDDV